MNINRIIVISDEGVHEVIGWSGGSDQTGTIHECSFDLKSVSDPRSCDTCNSFDDLENCDSCVFHNNWTRREWKP